jgi:hypothetical protein
LLAFSVAFNLLARFAVVAHRHESAAQTLVAVGRAEEAEAHFRKALAASPNAAGVQCANWRNSQRTLRK